MRVGVTGGAGFIGQWVCQELKTRGHEVVVLDHRAERGEDGWGPNHLRAASVHKVFLGDTRDETAVTEFAAYVDGIIHLASVLGTQETVHNPRPAVMTNVVSGMNVLEAATQYKLPVVNICVGNAGMSNPYSASKTCVESLGHMYVRDRGTKLNQVRVVNAYGPRQVPAAPFGPSKVRKIMPAFICRALAGQDIEIYGDGKQISDCVWVGDVATALVNALELAAAGEIFPVVSEVGPRDSRTVLSVAHDVIGSVVTTTGRPAVGIRHLPMRPGETPGAVVRADPDTLKWVAMDHRHLLSLAVGIQRTVEWYAQHWLPTWKPAVDPSRRETTSLRGQVEIEVEPDSGPDANPKPVPTRWSQVRIPRELLEES